MPTEARCQVTSSVVRFDLRIRGRILRGAAVHGCGGILTSVRRRGESLLDLARNHLAIRERDGSKALLWTRLSFREGDRFVRVRAGDVEVLAAYPVGAEEPEDVADPGRSS